MGRRRPWVLPTAGLGLAVLYLLNASWLAHPSGRLTVLAHRGVHQTFSEAGVTDATCTARRIDPPAHAYLENTLPSIRRAFELGADMVEIDVHPTTDGEFVVFHDWTLDCRTNGHGATRDHSLAALKALDIGWGYTADGGRTFPLRGRGVGLMPTLGETLAAFPGRRLLINIKSNDPTEADRLAAYLHAHDLGGLSRLRVYGGEAPMAQLAAIAPELAGYSKGRFKACMGQYLAVGWTGHVPRACRRGVLLIPQAQAGLLWGWPNRFLVRMQGADTDVYVGGELRLKPRQSILGLDDPAQLARLPKAWRGGVSTERIDVIGPALAGRR